MAATTQNQGTALFKKEKKQIKLIDCASRSLPSSLPGICALSITEDSVIAAGISDLIKLTLENWLKLIF